MVGRYCRVEPIEAARHASELFAANAEDDGRMWTYLSVGPFENEAAYRGWVQSIERSEDPLFYAIVDTATGRAVGYARTCGSIHRMG